MANVTATYTPSNIIQGPADVFIGVASPPSAVPPVQGTNTWAGPDASGSYLVDKNGQPTDNSTVGGIYSISAVSGTMTSYAQGDVFSVTQSGASGGYIEVVAAPSGTITSWAVIQDGTGYSTASGLATAAVTGVGSGAKVTIGSIFAGFHIGLSDGPVTMNIAPKFKEIRADQHAAPVDAAFVSMDTEISFPVKEALLRNLQPFFSSVIGQYTNIPYTTGTVAADFLQIGSTNTDAVIFHPLLLVSPLRTSVGNFIIVNAYKAMLKSAVETTFKRDQETIWKLSFYCIADVSRVYSDMVAQVVLTS